MDEQIMSHSDTPISSSIENTYARHFDMVYRICYSYLKNAADAEDATADVFVRLIAKSPEFQSPEHEKSWIIRVTVNVCKDVLKHWWHDRANIDDYEHLHGADEYHVDETLCKIMSMPPRYKEVIYLYYYEGYTTNEIASMLRKPRSTIRNHLREARIFLQGVIENEE
ncbi:MAG: sigma-70 family RNA polymerase sigma factor [Oscillospiraceae bacterium]|nr:sigma-70 family RNA polymerase sigma factor [Oscillospiraceae bacterium]